MKPEHRRGSAFRRAVVLPTVLLLGAGGALVAGPAFADTAPTAPVTTAAADPTATPSVTTAPDPTPTVTSTPDPTPSVTTTPSPVSTAPSTSAPTSAPKKESAPPKDLLVTSPLTDDDGDPVVVHGDRVVTITGRAPVGSAITVTTDEGKTTSPVGTDANGDWKVVVTVSDSASYDQLLEIDGTYRGKDLTSEYVEVLFDAPQSAAPVITSPVTGDTVVGEPEPFVGTDSAFGSLAGFTVSGTGTPGDDVAIEADEATSNPDDGGFGFGGEATVSPDGTWTTQVDATFARYTLTAVQQKLDDDFNPLSVASDNSNSVAVLVSEPVGFVEAPNITAPAYPDDSADGSDSGDASGDGFVVVSGDGSAANTQASDRSTLTIPGLATPEARKVPELGTAAATARLKARADATASDDSGSSTADDSGTSDDLDPADLDAVVEQIGIPVKGVADPTGAVATTVSGTGTPGDGIVLYAAKPSVALPYFEGLYPDVFMGSGLDTSAVAPTSPPVDDGSITVGADGKWTTTMDLPTGPAFLTAFAVDRGAGTAPTYSVAGSLLPLEVTATPAAVTAAAATDPATLAFTGSDDRGALAVGLSALLAGGALVVVNARRRRRGDATDES